MNLFGYFKYFSYLCITINKTLNNYGNKDNKQSSEQTPLRDCT